MDISINKEKQYMDCDKCADNGYWFQWSKRLGFYTIYCKYCNANPDSEPINPILEKGKEQ